MNKLEKLSANFKQITFEEQSFIFGGEKTTGSFCHTNTCVEGESDTRIDRYDEEGNEIESRTITYESNCD